MGRGNTWKALLSPTFCSVHFIPQLFTGRTPCLKLFLLTLNHLCLLQRKKLLLHCLKNQSKGNICSKLLASNYCLLCIITYWSNVTKLKLFFPCACFYALHWYKMCGLLKINLQLKLCLHRAEPTCTLMQLRAQLEHSGRLPLKGLLFTPP